MMRKKVIFEKIIKKIIKFLFFVFFICPPTYSYNKKIENPSFRENLKIFFYAQIKPFPNMSQK